MRTGPPPTLDRRCVRPAALASAQAGIPVLDELHPVDLNRFQERDVARAVPLEDDGAVQHGQDPDRLAVYGCIERVWMSSSACRSRCKLGSYQ